MVEQRPDDPTRASWTRLLGDHDRIAQHCAALAALARRADRPVEDASIRLLELTVCVADHLGVEDQVIDLTAVAMRNGASAEQVAAMTAELDVLKADWTDFIVRWTPVAIAGDWDGFTAATEAMLPRLGAQVRRENELLYAEALRRGVIDSGRLILH